MSALDGAFIHFRNGNARKSSKFQRVTKRVLQFPQFPFGHFVFISRSEIFAFYFVFLFSALDIHRGPVLLLLLLLGPLAGQSIKFFSVPTPRLLHAPTRWRHPSDT